VPPIPKYSISEQQFFGCLKRAYRNVGNMGEKTKKDKKVKKGADEVTAVPSERKLILAPIAKPLADEKLSKKAGVISWALILL
jgi:hypothetical protein